jgi:hypothetical protein
MPEDSQLAGRCHHMSINFNFIFIGKGKAKATPLQAWTGP